jgi:hypothetical protein
VSVDESSQCEPAGPGAAGDDLASRRLVTVVLRLVLCRRGELASGELVDERNRVFGRFQTWEGLIVTLRRWLQAPEERLERRRRADDQP